MSWQKTGRMTQPQPREEQHQVCDHCGKVICFENRRMPIWEIRYDADLPYPDHGMDENYDFCSLACLAQWAQAEAAKRPAEAGAPA